LPPDPKTVEAFGALSSTPNLSYENGSWRAVPNTELHATQDKRTDDDEQLMHFTEDRPENYWPVYKGGSFNIWNPETGEVYAWADPELGLDTVFESRKSSYKWAGSRSAFSEFSEEWINDKNTLSCLSPRVTFRDVARATDTRTTIPALIPGDTFLQHTAPYFLWPKGDERDEAYLLGVMSSIPLDWYSRRFVENHLTYHIVNSFPIPRPGRDNLLRQRVVELSGCLAAVDERYADWADAVGVECGSLDEETKRKKIYELDAVVAHLYGLTREQVKVIFETFHDGWNYEERLGQVLDYYKSWNDRLDLDHSETIATQEPLETEDDD
jgi:hypothetical protein